MTHRDADRNLLFGINALQNDFITRDALIAAMNAWALEKHRPLGDILVERNALNPADRDLLNQLIDRHLARHGGDPAASLAAMSSVASIADDLRKEVADPDVQESIANIPTGSQVDPHATRAPETVDYIPAGVRYHKVRDHAKGGLGVVFVARDNELNREVALKEIKPEYADNLDRQARFLIEAEITGGLEHPGIVPVYGLGHYDDGRPYYAMRFIRGGSLKDAINTFHTDKSLKNDPGAQALALQKLLRRFLDVCNAVAYAHSRGVLHRDLKPDNVMVGRYGETLVVDWGLAKSVGRSGEDDYGPLPESSLMYSSSSGSAETLPGSVIGTPGYMSPEQAAGRLDLLGPASDVYSLGATLYTLLTGSVPVAGKDISEILRKVERGDYPRPREASPWIDPALEAICMKAMSLLPETRFASPKALASDIELWLADEPVSSFSEGYSLRLVRWTRRHRAWVQAGVAVSLLTTLFSILSAVLIDRSRRNEQRSLEKANAALSAERLAKAEEGKATRASRRDDYFSSMALVWKELEHPKAFFSSKAHWAQGDLERARRLLSKYVQTDENGWDCRGFEWGYLAQRYLDIAANTADPSKMPEEPALILRGHEGEVQDVDLSHDGRWLASAGADGTVRVWDLNSIMIAKTLRGHQKSVTSVSLSNDGKRVASGGYDGTVRVWDVQDGREMEVLRGHEGVVSGVAIGGDGLRVVSIGYDKTVRLWDTEEARPLQVFRGHEAPAYRVILSPDGRRVASAGGGDETVRIWEIGLDRAQFVLSARGGYIWSVTYSPDGLLVASGNGGGQIRIWDAKTGHERSIIHPDQGVVFGLAFSPDGRRIVSGAIDGTVRIWDVETGREVFAFQMQTYIRDVAFSGDGRFLAAAGADGTIRLWVSAMKPSVELPVIPVPRPVGD